ncbi:MAG: cysteine peptidase family C39 domain-containing protein [Candidatus Poribacteria bacterium]|nr:cysteine peptidase family C39 domain-containing protein [Candidatus Poribacteria bacterium]
MKVLVISLLIVLIVVPPAFVAEDKQTSDVTSLYHFANILGIQVSLVQVENVLIQKTAEPHDTDFTNLIDAAKEVGLELQERNLNYEELREFKTPVIAYLKTTFEDENPANADPTVGHFIVVEYANKKWARLFDTPNRLLYQAATVVSRDRFLDLWTGRVLTLSESQRQQRQPVLNVSPTLLDLDALITLQRGFAEQDLAGYQFPVRLKNRSDAPIQIISVAGNT